MKIYDTNYGPDTFGRIRMGLITEMFLTFDGYLKPEVGDHLRISCLFKGVVRDVYTVVIAQISDCVDEADTVLIRITPKLKPAQIRAEASDVMAYKATDEPLLSNRRILH
ncbi:hypothetical protein [Pantoea sp.]|uniref:hypothetical protein n=1 Tax=Pantoea sp. TaxID=69393 RepID=UPI0031CF11D7